MIGVVGEALIDIRADEVDGLPSAGTVGGSPFNVARGVARLGGPVRFLGRTSTDAAGKRLRAALLEDGVDLAPALVGDEPTPIAVVEIDASGDASYRFRWDGTADRQITTEALSSAARGVSILHVGSVGALLEPGADAIRAFVEQHPTPLLTYDPNVRRVGVDLATIRRSVESWVRRSDLVKASEDDLITLFPDVDPYDTARRWASEGHVVIVTLGSAGATYFDATGSQRVPGRDVDVVDTVGAGDAFMAAVLVQLLEAGTTAKRLRQLEWDLLLERAVEVATQTCLRRGADPPRRRHVSW